MRKKCDTPSKYAFLWIFENYIAFRKDSTTNVTTFPLYLSEKEVT